MARKGSVAKRTARPADTPRGVPGRVLGLDVSSVCVGWALFDSGVRIQHGKFLMPGDDHAERLVAFEAWLQAHLERVEADELVVEMPYPGRRRHAYGVLMMYFAVVLMTYRRVFARPMPTTSQVPAARIKRVLRLPKLTEHAERKRQMVRIINERYALNLKYKERDPKKRISDDDVADAIALVDVWLTLQEAA